MFIAQEFIRTKRDNKPLSKEMIDDFIKGVMDETVTNEHISAFAMAVFFNSLDMDERTFLTQAMRDSGNVLQWDNLNGPVVDKHSTGGVGDVVSLMLGPILSACGAYVPMISGRGLGHTGGTLDKFESIIGYNVTPDDQLFAKVVKECGVAIIGQTSSLAPADKRIYSIRDTTSTVESVAMISSSILAKKLAEGLDALCLDVKVGSGAFMPTYEKSKELAQSIVTIANKAGVKCEAVLTDMNQVLASTAGNAVEVFEAVEYLMNKNINPRLHAVTKALCSSSLVIAGLYKTEEQAGKKVEEVLKNGKALEIFSKMVNMLGGPLDFVEKYDTYLTKAPIIRPIYAQQTGIVESMNTIEIGMAVVGLGGGRMKPSDKIDHSVGFSQMIKLGEKVDSQTPIAFVHAKDEDTFKFAEQKVLNALKIGDKAPKIQEIYETVTYDENQK